MVASLRQPYAAAMRILPNVRNVTETGTKCARGLPDIYRCGHPRTAENASGHSRPLCRICKNERMRLDRAAERAAADPKGNSEPVLPEATQTYRAMATGSAALRDAILIMLWERDARLRHAERRMIGGAA